MPNKKNEEKKENIKKTSNIRYDALIRKKYFKSMNRDRLFQCYEDLRRNNR